jgi:4-diphosphocytidyl-2-C-methyl-D-erythritol kinase
MPTLPPDRLPTRLFEHAPAKLNLYLHVLGRDHRNYHLLDSLVAFADACDILRALPAGQFSLTIDGPCGAGLEADERNLVWRAAIGLGELAGRSPDYAVRLTKTLPLASGIGGGSADAAAMLRLLCREWGIDPLSAEVMALGKSLGEDIPVCIASRTSYMGGTGEVLDACPALPNAALVLINPGVKVPTKAVFARRSGPFSEAGRLAEIPARSEALATALATRRNDLQAPAIELAPEIASVLQALAGNPDCLIARMLGSGATCYGLFTSAEKAQIFARSIGQSHPGWWVHQGRLINSLDDLTQGYP